MEELKLKKLVQLLIVLVFLSSTSITVFAYHDTEYVIRLYNPNTTEHLFTTSIDEGNALLKLGWKQEAESWLSVKDYGTPVYRLYNASIDDHLFTSDKNETETLTQNGWTLDNGGNPVFYSLGKMPVYRLYSPVTKRHHLTVSREEYDILATQMWKEEYDIPTGMDGIVTSVNSVEPLWKQEGEGFYGVEPVAFNIPSSDKIYPALSYPACDDDGVDVNTYGPGSNTPNNPGDNTHNYPTDSILSPGSKFY